MSTIIQAVGGHYADAAMRMMRMMQQFPEVPERADAIQEVPSQLSNWAPETAARTADEAAAKRWLENTAALSPEKKKKMPGK